VFLWQWVFFCLMLVIYFHEERRHTSTKCTLKWIISQQSQNLEIFSDYAIKFQKKSVSLSFLFIGIEWNTQICVIKPWSSLFEQFVRSKRWGCLRQFLVLEHVFKLCMFDFTSPMMNIQKIYSNFQNFGKAVSLTARQDTLPVMYIISIIQNLNVFFQPKTYMQRTHVQFTFTLISVIVHTDQIVPNHSRLVAAPIVSVTVHSSSHFIIYSLLFSYRQSPHWILPSIASETIWHNL
jgi:hypothetical protein